MAFLVRTLYRESIRVPLIIVYPRKIQSNQRVKKLASLVDILPTVLSLAKVPYTGKVHGVDLVPQMDIKGRWWPVRSPSLERDLFAELGPVGFEWSGPGPTRRAIYADDRKLIITYGSDGAFEHELYDLSRDRLEREDIHGDPREEKKLQQLQSRLLDFVNEGQRYMPHVRDKNNVELPPDLLERLRALGYVN